VGRSKHESNGFQHAVHLSIDFAVGETENPIAAFPQFLISHVVTASMLIKAMLMTIDLDDQARSTTFKVHNIR
jgi:hypothetical protein